MVPGDISVIYDKKLTEKIIGCAIEVHKHLGPGLLESAYEECLCHELRTKDISYKRQQGLPLNYKGLNLDCGYRVDIIVDDRVIVELKCVEKILPVHEAQLLTYLKLSSIQVGLIINFNSTLLKTGIKRLVFNCFFRDIRVSVAEKLVTTEARRAQREARLQSG